MHASEEEKNKEKHNQRSMDYSEDEGSDSASNDGSSSDEVADFDEYAAFETDLEKHGHDLEKWNGIQNTRKYVTKKKNGGEDQRKRKRNGDEEAKRTTKSRRLGQPNSLAQSSENEKHEEEAPTQEPTVQVPKEGEIHFDMIGNMWYSDQKDGSGRREPWKSLESVQVA